MAIHLFKEYTYKISYKESFSSEEVLLTEELRIIDAYTSVVNSNGEVVQAPNPNYNFFMTTLITHVTPINNAIIIIRRNAIKEGDVIIAAEKEVYTGSIDFLSYDKRIGFLITDNDVNDSTIYKILVQILNINNNERIPCKYLFDHVEFVAPPTEPQHIDVSYKEKNALEFIPLGTNITVSSLGVFEGIELGELPDDTEYIVRIYHRELEQEKEFLFRTNIVPTIGLNPIVDKIEWNGRIMLLDAPDVKNRMYPAINTVNWMFAMDYSTKSFANILSSLWTSDDYGGSKENYHFEMRTSHDNSNETYIGCNINKDHYLSLPINYVNGGLPDNGASHNIHYKDLFITSSANERNTIFCKFYIDGTSGEGSIKLINFSNESTEHFIGFVIHNDGSISFSVFGKTFTVNIQKDKWYTLVLVCSNNNIVHTSITDYDNYSNDIIPMESGVKVGNVNSKSKLYSAERRDVNIELVYNATSDVPESGIGICMDYALYQYEENSPDNNQIDKGKTDYNIVHSGNDQVISFTVPNVGGYGIAIGYSIAFLYGGSTASGSITITDIKVNGVSKFADIDNYEFNIDSAVTQYMNGTRKNINFIKTGDGVLTPVGGIYIPNISLDVSIVDNAQVFIGKGANMQTSSYLVSRFGMRKTTIVEGDDWKNPYQYLDSTVFEALGGGYKKMPKLECTNGDDKVYIPVTNMTEMKDGTVRFLLERLPVGETTIKVLSGTDVLSTVVRQIKSVKLTYDEAIYDIDFENDFDNAIIEFKKRYYAKQKRWGGNMGGGTHGSLIYFNRSLKSLILEQHGDKYRGRVPAVAPAGAEGYGLPVDIIECPSSFEYPLEQRACRVGGLIQSIDYHPYGMFDCWFKVPKGMGGLAICLWYFHYQEIYDYDRDFKFWTTEGWNGYSFKDCISSGYGANWIVVNNEIDMELGSENTPYRTDVNPNDDTSIYWYVPGLSMRQCIGCTQEGSNYGTWLIDWDASKSIIDSVTETDPQNPDSYLRTDRLTWVKITDTIDEVNYGATNRSCRFNNWIAERWNDGAGIYETPDKSPLGKNEFTVNNRTPLGKIDPKAIQQSLRYIEKYYDDGEYHKWSIDWHKDYTRLLIDDDVIAINKAFVPFNPMTMLIGCWFPSANVYDKDAILGNWGTWAGIHANWEVALMEVKRIKFLPYTEAECPTNEMRYDCETYAQDGLKLIL